MKTDFKKPYEIGTENFDYLSVQLVTPSIEGISQNDEVLLLHKHETENFGTIETQMFLSQEDALKLMNWLQRALRHNRHLKLT